MDRLTFWQLNNSDMNSADEPISTENNEYNPSLTPSNPDTTPQYIVKSIGAKNKKGFRGTYIICNDVILSYSTADNITYNTKDCVYIENVQPDQPFYISIIQKFELTSANKLMVHVKWFFRHSEIPYNIYQMLIQDRKNEKNTGREQTKGPSLGSRELFVSEATDTYPVSALRGKCEVTQYSDLKTAKEAESELEKFFYVLGYHPDTKRLATTQGEIRVGSSHQARLPECKPTMRPRDMPERPEDYEDMMWRPENILDADLMMYLRAARSVAAFAGMCDGGSTEDGCQAASMDDTTVNAMDTLHEFMYDTGSALQAIIKCPVPRTIDKSWTEDEVKRFVKGLRQFGKNFFKICKELLAHKETCDLVEFYYFWKKTNNASNFRSHRRHRRQAGMKKQNTRSQRPASSEFLDVTSASDLSDLDSVSDDSDSRDLTGYTCRRCFTTTSKDWHHGGKDKSLLCTECRVFFKKYGEDRPIQSGGEPPPFLFRPVKEDEESGSGLNDMRPRQIKELVGHLRNKERNSTSSPDNIDSPLHSSENSVKMDSGRKSPSSGSTCSTSSVDPAAKDGGDSLPGSKRLSDNVADDDHNVKKSRDAPDWESCSDSSSVSGQDENGCDGDVENNQDDLSSSAPSSIPGTPPPHTAIDDAKPPDFLSHIKLEQDLPPTDSHTIESASRDMSLAPPASIKQEPTTNHPEAIPSTTTSVSSPYPNNDAPRQNSPFQSFPAAVPATSPLPNPPPLHPVQMGNHVPYYFQPFAPHLGMPNYPPLHPPFLPPQVPKPQKQSPSPSPNASAITRTPPPSDGNKSTYTTSTSVCEPRASPHTFHPTMSSPALVPSPAPNRSSPLIHRPLLSPHLPSPGTQRSSPTVHRPSISPLNSTIIRSSPTLPRTSPTLQRSSPTLQRSSPTPHRSSPALQASSALHRSSPTPHRSSPAPHRLSPLPALHQALPIAHLSHSNPSILPSTMHNPSLPPPPPLQPLTQKQPEPLLSPKIEYPEDNLKCNETDLHIKPEPQTSGYEGDEHQSDNEQRGTPSPGPVPTPCHEELLITKNAIFMKLLDRGYNSCSRCDLVFKPHPDSKLAKRREERARKSLSRLSSPASCTSVKEEKKTTEDKHSSADAHITSSFTPSQALSYQERHTPRPYPGHDTPALRQLSEYARPHVLGHELARPLPYGLGGPLPSHTDPMLHYRMASMYPPGSRERLEFELERDKRERDARERELRERELREMELREKMMCDMDMKPPGFERLMMPHGANPLDPHWIEMQRRYYQAAANGHPLPPGLNPHLPGVYPPTSIANDLIARDRERLERLGIPPSALFIDAAAAAGPIPPEISERLQAEQRLAMADPVMRLQMNNISRSQSHMHTHAHSHTHLHLHQQQEIAAGLRAQSNLAQGLPAQSHPFHPLPNPAHPLLIPPGPDPLQGHHMPGLPPPYLHGRERDMVHPDLLRSPYTDSALAHHLSAQAAHHEAMQRQLAMDRERFGSMH